MTEHEDHNYFGQVERELRNAIRRGEHLSGLRHSRSRAIAARARLGLPLGRLGFALVGAAAIVATAIVLFTVGFGAGTQQAFAGWRPVPTRPAKGQRSAAEQSCRSMLSSLKTLERWNASKAVGIPKDHEGEALERLERSARRKVPAGHWRTVAVDTRGPYTLSLLLDGHRQAECFTGPRRSGHPFGAAAGVGSYNRAQTPAAGEIGNFAGGFTTVGGAKGRYTFAVGRAGAGIRAITLLLADGRHIVTTVAKGWYLAWWPGRSHAIGAKVRTASGTRTVHPNFP